MVTGESVKEVDNSNKIIVLEVAKWRRILNFIMVTAE
jgi:hypothetical protein